MKKHLLILFWNLSIGGIQTRIKDIVATTLKEGRVEQTTIVLFERGKNEVKLLAHPRLKIITFPGLLNLKMGNFRKRIWRFSNIQFVLWLYFIFWKYRPSYILTFLNKFSFYTALFVFFGRVFKLYNPVFIINEPVVISKYLKEKTNGTWWRLVVFSYKIADKIIVATNAVKMDIIRKFKAKPKKIVIVRSWVKSND